MSAENRMLRQQKVVLQYPNGLQRYPKGVLRSQTCVLRVQGTDHRPLGPGRAIYTIYSPRPPRSALGIATRVPWNESQKKAHTMNSSDATASGATAVITHRVREGREADYDNWLNEIGPLCQAAPGHLDWHIIRPIPDLTTTYTVIVRFDTCDHLRQWMGSPDREQLIKRARSLLVADDYYTIRSGLDFWFTPDAAKVPARWKQFLITWSAIYPLVLGVPLLVVPLLHRIGAPDNPYFTTLWVTATVVFLMVYVIMPHYTKLVRQWLFGAARRFA